MSVAYPQGNRVLWPALIGVANIGSYDRDR